MVKRAEMNDAITFQWRCEDTRVFTSPEPISVGLRCVESPMIDDRKKAGHDMRTIIRHASYIDNEWRIRHGTL